MLRWSLLFSSILVMVSSLGCEHMHKIFSTSRTVVDVKAKRPGDHRNFRTITLPNQLTVLLISDPQLNKSAAAMDVGVGSLSNPPEYPGLAHFLEHMLFLGTKKYPEVEEYSQYLAKFQGGSNAFTAEEDTNYHFEVNHDGYAGALDRFAQFFIAPLFSPEFVERELHAVDSEHQKNLKSDPWRLRRVFEVLHKPGHPQQIFGTGTLETLKKVDQQTLINFYRTYYSANLMKLVLMSPNSLDELENLAKTYFSEIANHDYKRPVFDSEIFTSDQLPRLVKVKPVKKLHRLEIAFASPSELPYWESKPASAIGHFLGYEGKGSLLSLLKKEGLATKIESGSESSTYTGSFHFDIELTDKGVKDWQKVIEHFFSYVELMRKEGYKRYVFDERKVMADIDYVYREPREGMNVASDYAMKMQTYPALDIDHDDLLIHKYSTDDFNHFLDVIRPEKMTVFLVGDEVETDQVEPYYGVAYKQERFASDFIKKLTNAPKNKLLSMPERNPFIPDALSLISSAKATESQKLLDTPEATFWFHLDDTFKLPKASIRLLILTQKTNGTPRNKMMAQLYAEALNESLNEWAYTIGLAGLHFDVSQSDKGIQLDVSGYSEKIPQLLEELSQKLNVITIDEQAFADIKTELKRKIANMVLNSAYWQTLYEMRYASSRTMIHSFDFYDPINKKGVDLISPVTLQELNEYVKTLYAETALEGASYGNLDAEVLKKSVLRFSTALHSKVLPIEQRPKEEIVQYPVGKDLAIVRQSQTNNNSWGVNVQFGPRDMKLNAAIRIGHAHLQTSFYSDLRTRQQLGYIVASNLSIHERVLGMLFLVQSASFSPFDIAQRAARWMEGAIHELESLSAEEFEAYKLATIQELREKDKTIQEKLETLYFEAIVMKGQFHYKESIARVAEKLTKKEMVDIFRGALLGPKRTSLAVYYTTDKDPKEKPMGTLLKDVKAFKAQTPIYE